MLADAPLLEAWMLVSANVAVMVCVPVSNAAGVYVTEQFALDELIVARVQVLNEPDAADDTKPSVPVGVSLVPAASVSVTVNVQAVPWLTFTGFGEHAPTDVDVVR